MAERLWTRTAPKAKRSVRALADALWPQRSLVAGAGAPATGALTPAEFAALHFITGTICHRCGTPLDGRETLLGADGPSCGGCLAHPPRWRRARAALAYDAAARRPVLDLKRSGRRDGLATLAGWMAMAGRDLLDEADLIVPVPLHYTRLVLRGFNQSAWLASALAKSTATPVSVDALLRVRATPSQAGLDPRARRRNVAGAFDVRKSRLALVRGRRIVLVDDVFTTGATVTGCTRALLKAGARTVDVLVLARVVRAAKPPI